MTRTISSNTLSAFTGPQSRPVVLAALEYDSGTVYAHTAVGEIEFDGNTYLGLGNFAGASGITEDGELSAASVQLQLSGVQAANISIALNENYQGRDATIWLGSLDETLLELVDDPILIFKGRMDNQNITLSGSSGTITLNVENINADWDRSNERRYNNETQQSLFPGDRGLEFTAQSAEKEIFWGVDNA